MQFLLCVALALVPWMAEEQNFERDFSGAAMRLDFFHSGDAGSEIVSLDQVRLEGPWPGSRTQMLDTLNRGKYFFEIVDSATTRVLYSRGFASIFGEWETTGEAKRMHRTFPEALRFPAPRRPFQARLRKRQADQSFREIWSATVDPDSRFVDRSPVPPADVSVLREEGPPAVKVDLLFLADGYAESERDAFIADARRLAEELFRVEPYRSRKHDFNVRAVFLPSPESGISKPRSGVFRRSALGARYNSFDSERYVLTFEDRAWRDAAAAAPYDAVVLLVNDRKYGGGGIYNLYATAAAHSSYGPYLFIHEFGHSFAGLGDEYYTSDVAYEDSGDRVEPWEPNITALGDPHRLKWRELVAEGTPVPTPWGKEAYEKASNESQGRRRKLRASGAAESELEALFDSERTLFTSMLGSDRYAGRPGAFEGASYQAHGLYRPEVDCIMFTRDEAGFCAVCSRAIQDVIDLLAR